MSELTQEERWQALLRGQVMGATINKFTTVLRLLDQKAQVMIFLNSILVPLCINALEEGTFLAAATLSIITSLLSIMAAIICIYPKRRYRKSGDRDLNLLHFNDIGHLDREEYVSQFLPALNDVSKLSEVVVNDLYDTSRYAILPKYVWLKISYGLFAIGNLLAVILVLDASH